MRVVRSRKLLRGRARAGTARSTKALVVARSRFCKGLADPLHFVRHMSSQVKAFSGQRPGSYQPSSRLLQKYTIVEIPSPKGRNRHSDFGLRISYVLLTFATRFS